MVQGVVTILAVIVVISLLPVAMLAAVFGIIDYLADDEKLEEIRRANRGGGSPDLSEGTAPSPGSTDDATGEFAIDPAEVSVAESEAAAETITCRSCGVDNEQGYEFCRNCASEL